MNQSMKEQCMIPPEGWQCTRAKGHDGPCAAIEKKKKSIWNQSIGGEKTPDQKSKPSWLAIIIWLILFWPIGVVLLIRRLW